MWTMVTDYCEMFKNTIRGKYDRKLQRYMVHLPNNSGPNSMSGGAQVRGILNDFLSDYMEVAITGDMSDDDIDRAIRVHEGDSLPGFPSPDTFEFLALPHLQQLSIPSVECVHNVASALDLLAQRIAHAVFRRFPKMAESALGMTQNIILREKDATRIIVEQQVACYVGYLFTNDPSYLIEHGSMEPIYQGQQKPPPPPEEEKKDPSMTEKTVQGFKEQSSALYAGAKSMLHRNDANSRKSQRYSGPFVTIIRKRLDAYFAITVRNVRDSVPKAIGFYLVRAVQDKLQFELLNALNQRDKLAELLGEPPHIMEERKTLTGQLQVLQKASAVLTRDPTLAAIALEAEDEDMQTQPTPAAPQARPATGAGGVGNMLRSAMGAGATGSAQAAASTASPPAATRPAIPGAGAGYPVSTAAGNSSLGSVPTGARPAAPATSSSLFGGAAQAKATGKAGIFDDGPATKPAPASNPLARPSGPSALFGD